MKIYSGECCMGECGKPTELYDDYCECEEVGEDFECKPIPNLFVGDIVVCANRENVENHWNSIEYIYGLCVVVEDADAGEPFVMGLKSIDFSTDNDKRKKWTIKKVKNWQDCIEGEIIPDCARITYKNE